jgi:hypothetical protein
MSPKVDSASSLRLRSSSSFSIGHSYVECEDAGPVGLEKLVVFLLATSLE